MSTEHGERDDADVWLVNSCTVKSPSQSQMATVLAEGRRRGKGIVVAGCVPQGDDKSPDLEVRPPLPHRETGFASGGPGSN